MLFPLRVVVLVLVLVRRFLKRLEERGVIEVSHIISHTLQESLQLLAHDDDPFSRWDAGQRLSRQVLLARAADQPDATVETALISALRQNVSAYGGSGGQDLAILLALPGTAELEALQNPVDPPALYAAQRDWIAELGRQLADPLHHLLKVSRGDWSQAWPAGQGARSLTGLAWSWLAAAGDVEARRQALEAVSGPSMTLARAALRALQPLDVAERDQALDCFYQRWQEKPVILDAWFALEASAPRPDGLQRVQRGSINLLDLIQYCHLEDVYQGCKHGLLQRYASYTPIALQAVCK